MLSLFDTQVYRQFGNSVAVPVLKLFKNMVAKKKWIHMLEHKQEIVYS
ncbi:hypothetical protein ACT7DD_31420 [Bacillus paranthracis]